MRPQSAKAKGRRLQQEVRDAILATFPVLQPGDVRSTSMGAGGSDILLSPYAEGHFPYATECKNVESLNVWKALEQARASAKTLGLTPLVVFRKNNTPPHVVLPLDVFLTLQRKANGDIAP